MLYPPSHNLLRCIVPVYITIYSFYQIYDSIPLALCCADAPLWDLLDPNKDIMDWLSTSIATGADAAAERATAARKQRLLQMARSGSLGVRSSGHGGAGGWKFSVGNPFAGRGGAGADARDVITTYEYTFDSDDEADFSDFNNVPPAENGSPIGVAAAAASSISSQGIHQQQQQQQATKQQQHLHNSQMGESTHHSQRTGQHHAASQHPGQRHVPGQHGHADVTSGKQYGPSQANGQYVGQHTGQRHAGGDHHQQHHGLHHHASQHTGQRHPAGQHNSQHRHAPHSPGQHGHYVGQHIGQQQLASQHRGQQPHMLNQPHPMQPALGYYGGYMQGGGMMGYPGFAYPQYGMMGLTGSMPYYMPQLTGHAAAYAGHTGVGVFYVPQLTAGGAGRPGSQSQHPGQYSGQPNGQSQHAGPPKHVQSPSNAGPAAALPSGVAYASFGKRQAVAK